MRFGKSPCHLGKVALADERPQIFPADKLDQVLARAGEDVPDEGDVILVGNVMFAVNGGIARERKPGSRVDAGRAEQFGPITLGRVDEVEAAGLLDAPLEVEMRVDGPPGGWSEIGR